MHLQLYTLIELSNGLEIWYESMQVLSFNHFHSFTNEYFILATREYYDVFIYDQM